MTCFRSPLKKKKKGSTLVTDGSIIYLAENGKEFASLSTVKDSKLKGVSTLDTAIIKEISNL